MQQMRRILGAVVAGVLLIGAAAGCARPPVENPPAVGSLTQAEETADGRVLITHVDLPVYRDIPALTAAAGEILIGTVTGMGEPVNLERDPRNPARELPDQKSMAQVYRVTAERWFKGRAAAQIEVAVPDYVLRKGGARFKEPYAQLEVGQRYLLFLEKGATLYHGVGEPWHFRLNGGRAEIRVGAEFSGDLKLLSGFSESALIQAVQKHSRN